MVVPWGYFLDAKNHKPPTFSRKIKGLRFQNVAVKERFESTRTLNRSAETPEYKGSSGASCEKAFPRHSHAHQHAPQYACASHVEGPEIQNLEGGKKKSNISNLDRFSRSSH